jgi:two-component system sporulation sensor kinase A
MDSLTYEETATTNGDCKTYETTIIPVYEDELCNHIIGIARDITDRKNDEEEILRTKEEFRKVIHNQQGLIFSVEKKNEEYYYTLFDGQIISELERLPEQVVGKRPQDIMPISIANEVISKYDQCWHTQEKVVFEESGLNGFVLLTIINPVIEKGETVTIIGSTVDISEKRKAEETLVKKEKLSLLGELSAGIGHEIRNPLTTIKGFIKIMKEDKQNIKTEFLDVIEAELESIDRIAGELMMLAKPQAQQTVTFDIISLVRDVVFLMESQAFTKGVFIQLHTSSQNLYVNGDRNQIKQVFLNLIKNAIESMDSNLKGSVKINCEHSDSKVLIRVTDEGCGITEGKLKSIGEPFYTTKNKGNGLGLMITQRIIRNHDGTLLCQSEVGKGTTFTVCLPQATGK